MQTKIRKHVIYNWRTPIRVGILTVGALDSGSLVWEDAGSSPSVPNSSVWDGGQWRDSVSLARVDPALNGYLEKSGEGKQEGCAKAQDGWPPTPHCTSLAEGPRNGDQHRRYVL